MKVSPPVVVAVIALVAAVAAVLVLRAAPDTTPASEGVRRAPASVLDKRQVQPLKIDPKGDRVPLALDDPEVMKKIRTRAIAEAKLAKTLDDDGVSGEEKAARLRKRGQATLDEMNRRLQALDDDVGLTAEARAEIQAAIDDAGRTLDDMASSLANGGRLGERPRDFLRTIRQDVREVARATVPEQDLDAVDEHFGKGTTLAR